MTRFTLAFTVLAASALTAACVPNEQGLVSADEIGDLSAGPVPRGDALATFTEACGVETATQRGASELLRQPYLQRVTAEGAWLLWTSTGASTAVDVTLPDGTPVLEAAAELDASAPLPLGQQYVARIGGLEADTLYCYSIRDEADVLYRPTGFRTAPVTGSTAPIRIAAFGDLGERDPDQFAVLEQLATVEYDFALLTGDIAYASGTLTQFEDNVFDVYADLMRSVPFFVASGNHDYKTADAEPFRQVFALFENGAPAGVERWYSYDWGMLHVAVIDTEKLFEEQKAWLEADLAANELPWTIVVGHRPPYSSGYHGSSASVRDAFQPILARYGVDLALWGHDHDYERIKPQDGVSHIVTGGAGKGTRPVGTSSFTGFSLQVAHFAYITVDEHELKLWAIDATGQEFDSLVLQK